VTSAEQEVGEGPRAFAWRAHQLATAKTFLFDGSDLLPGAFGDTWGFALQDVIQKPGNIKSILSTFQNKIQGQF
jgi:hypothetical protein